MKKRLVIIDGNSLLFRAYYATAYGDSSSIMRTKSGIPTNAIFAFSNMISKIIKDLSINDYLFVGFDADGDTFRKEEFSEYKANRKPVPEDLIPQFAISREYLKSLSISFYEEKGIEADDICGTIAKEASKEDFDVLIYTSDHDYLQLIDKNIKVSLLKVGLSNMELYDEAYLKEKMNLTPSQIVDFKALAGDSSDNYPGVSGIGEKTAVKLINEYGDLAHILESAPSIKGKLGEKLLLGKESALLSYHLAKIKVDAKLPFSLEDLAYKGYLFEEANAFAQKYELRQMINRLPTALKRGSNDLSSFSYEIKKELPKSILDSKTISIALDINYEEYHSKEPFGLAISNGQETIYLDIEDITKAKDILEDNEIKKVVYDGKASIYALNKLGISLKNIQEDILLGAYLLDSSILSSPSEVYRSLGVDIEGDEISLLNDSSSKEKASKMAYYSLTILDKLHQSLLDNEALPLYRNIELPLMKVLGKMELEGFPLNKEELKEIGEVFYQKRDQLEKELYLLANEKFNPNSPKQVAYILYDKLALKEGKSRGTSLSDLTSIQDKHPIVSKILEYRKYAKLLGTYIDGLLIHIQEDGKIHSYFNQAQTTTGRLSSSSPNLQNITSRDEEARSIRKAFHYENDLNLLSFDYSQIELRLLAALSGCEEYMSLFTSGNDVHSETAKKIFHTENITPLMRRKAKAVNFAIIYGTTVYGLSEQINDTPMEASRIIREFYASYPGVGAYLNEIVKQAERQGYVNTMFGRRRYFRDINDPNFSKREAARRAALNAPIQGSAADLIKIAMIKIDDFLLKGGYKTKMVLQIHDELIFAVPDNEVETMSSKIKEIMEEAIKLPIPLTVELGIGKTWYDAKD